MTAPAGRLAVTADFRMEVGGTTATVTGSGQHLVVRSPHPELLWAELNGAALPESVGRINGPRSVGRVAELLRQYGLDLDIEGPDGVLVRLGSGAHSWWGARLTGSSAVQLVSARSLPPMAANLLLHSRAGRGGVGVLAASVVGAAVAAVIRSRRRRHG